VQTKPNYGGVRWSFRCPRSGRQVAKLFLLLGSSQFWSWKAYGPGYACQRAAPTDRVHIQGYKLYRSLGGEGDWQQEFPEKPIWMQWRTYNRKIERLDALAEKLEALWEPRILRLMQRLL